MIIDVQLQAVRRNRVSKNYIEWYCLCVGPRAPQVYCRPPQAFQQHGANYVLAHWSPGYGSFYGKAIYPSSKPCVVSTTHFTVSEDTVNLAFSNLVRGCLRGLVLHEHTATFFTPDSFGTVLPVGVLSQPCKWAPSLLWAFWCTTSRSMLSCFCCFLLEGWAGPISRFPILFLLLWTIPLPPSYGTCVSDSGWRPWSPAWPCASSFKGH